MTDHTPQKKRRMPQRRLEGEAADTVVAMFKDNKPMADIALAVGFEETTVRRALRRAGIPGRYGGLRGSDHPSWVGGRYTGQMGYIDINRSALTPAQLQVVGPERQFKEHRVIMAEHLGRPLLRNENVHHINGVKDDNRIENLELWITSQPPGQRVEDIVAWAREILATYGEEVG